MKWVEDLKERWAQALKRRCPCPRCQSRRVWRNGVRWRKASLRHGDQTVYLAEVPVRRLRCALCGHRFSVSPPEVPWRAHYQPCVVGAAVLADALEGGGSPAQVAQEYGCARRTLQRWVHRVAGLAAPWELSRRLAQQAPAQAVPSLPAPVKPRRSASRHQVAQRAAWVLVLLEALGSLLGLQPPGLGHAWRFCPSLSPRRGQEVQ